MPKEYNKVSQLFLLYIQIYKQHNICWKAFLLDVTEEYFKPYIAFCEQINIRLKTKAIKTPKQYMKCKNKLKMHMYKEKKHLNTAFSSYPKSSIASHSKTYCILPKL